MSLGLTEIDKALKTIYRDDLLEDLVYKRNPFLAMVPKYEKFSAKDMKFPLLYGNPQSISATFADAQAASLTLSSKWAGFSVTRANKHGVAVIDGETIASTRSDTDAFVRAIKSEVDSMLNGLTNRLCVEAFAQGWGDLGQIGSSSGSTITLKNKADVVRVEVGQAHVFSSSQNAATLRDSGDDLVVTAVDRQTGVITYAEAVSTIVGLANDDFIFIKGDRQNSATPSRLCMVGIEGWIPATAPTSGDSFFGQDRSTDATRLAGLRQDSSGQPLEEALLDADSAVYREGGALSHFLMAPKTFADLVKAMGSRVRYQQVSAGKVGFHSVMVAGQEGDIACVADRSVPSNRIYGVTLESWELASDKKLVRINDDDGLTMLRQASADGVEVRAISRHQLVCNAPAHNINVQI